MLTPFYKLKTPDNKLYFEMKSQTNLKNKLVLRIGIRTKCALVELNTLSIFLSVTS